LRYCNTARATHNRTSDDGIFGGLGLVGLSRRGFWSKAAQINGGIRKRKPTTTCGGKERRKYGWKEGRKEGRKGDWKREGREWKEYWKECEIPS
jgi:hypothetical protein